MGFTIGLIVIPGVLVGIIGFRIAADALVDRSGQQLVVLARDVGLEIASEVSALAVDVEAWARQEVMRDVAIGDIDKRIAQALQTIARTYPGLHDLRVADAGGTVIAATDVADLGRRLVDPPYAFVAGRQVLRWDRAGGVRMVELRAAIQDPETPGVRLGQMVARYEWGHIAALVDRVRSGLLGSGIAVDFVLLDDADHLFGAPTTAPDDTVVETIEDRGWAAVTTLASGAIPGFVLEPELDAIVAYVPGMVDPPAWRVLAMQGRGQATAPAYALRRRVIVTLGVVLTIALALGASFAQRMIRPLRALTDGARELAATGALEAPLPVTSHDEIGELSEAFNVAASNLDRARADFVTASKLAFVGELAAGMAHEIRTPLGILRSSVQMLERVPDERPAERRELLEMMVGEVDRLDRVVSGLVDLARPHPLAKGPTALRDLLARAVDFVAVRAASQGVTIRSVLDEPSVASCDPDEMYQVVLNLLMNALQVMRQGGGILVRTQPPHDGRVGFEVTDNGPGIALDRQAQIFTPFVSFRDGGTGLGLAMAQRIVLAHGGTITVHSTPGHGATFRVVLPAHWDQT